MNARLTADERRDEVVAAAAIEFAAGGFAGTSTAAIARRAGVSQPYLFQLFGTKKELFLAATGDCFARTRRRFEESGREARSAGLSADRVLERMGHAYVDMLLADRNLLRLQLHAYAACDGSRDPGGRASRVLGPVAGRRSGVGGLAEAVHGWFAEGMLINVIASVGDARTLEEFDMSLLGGGHPTT